MYVRHKIIWLSLPALILCTCVGSPQAQSPERTSETPRMKAVLERVHYVAANRVIFFISLTNKSDADLWLIPAYPQKDKVLTTDTAGTLYTLETIIGMTRQQSEAFLVQSWGTFLHLPPQTPVQTSYVFTAQQPPSQKTPLHFSAELVIVPNRNEQQTFTTTITFLNVAAD